MTDAKKLILARRARFVAAAIAGIGTAVACEPEVCLSVIPATDAGTDAKDTGPQVCLEPPFDAGEEENDAGDASDQGDAGDAGDASDGGDGG